MYYYTCSIFCWKNQTSCFTLDRRIMNLSARKCNLISIYQVALPTDREEYLSMNNIYLAVHENTSAADMYSLIVMIQ